jgi:hypothetical protein
MVNQRFNGIEYFLVSNTIGGRFFIQRFETQMPSGYLGYHSNMNFPYFYVEQIW